MSAIEKYENKIFQGKRVLSEIKKWKAQRHRIVFTNGCFDILHFGHLYYLAEARVLGDKLIVGLNNDSSVRLLKGESRPINDQYYRAMQLAALEFVDGIVYFEEATPYDLIKMVQPDVLVKGGDYTKEDVVGADIVEGAGGIVEIIPFLEGFSTSAIVKLLSQ